MASQETHSNHGDEQDTMSSGQPNTDQDESTQTHNGDPPPFTDILVSKTKIAEEAKGSNPHFKLWLSSATPQVVAYFDTSAQYMLFDPQIFTDWESNLSVVFKIMDMEPYPLPTPPDPLCVFMNTIIPNTYLKISTNLVSAGKYKVYFESLLKIEDAQTFKISVNPTENNNFNFYRTQNGQTVYLTPSNTNPVKTIVATATDPNYPFSVAHITNYPFIGDMKTDQGAAQDNQ